MLQPDKIKRKAIVTFKYLSYSNIKFYKNNVIYVFLHTLVAISLYLSLTKWIEIETNYVVFKIILSNNFLFSYFPFILYF